MQYQHTKNLNRNKHLPLCLGTGPPGRQTQEDNERGEGERVSLSLYTTVCVKLYGFSYEPWCSFKFDFCCINMMSLHPVFTLVKEGCGEGGSAGGRVGSLMFQGFALSLSLSHSLCFNPDNGWRAKTKHSCPLFPLWDPEC